LKILTFEKQLASHQGIDTLAGHNRCAVDVRFYQRVGSHDVGKGWNKHEF
jgi:hypothetical protein